MLLLTNLTFYYLHITFFFVHLLVVVSRGGKRLLKRWSNWRYAYLLEQGSPVLWINKYREWIRRQAMKYLTHKPCICIFNWCSLLKIGYLRGGSSAFVQAPWGPVCRWNQWASMWYGLWSKLYSTSQANSTSLLRSRFVVWWLQSLVKHWKCFSSNWGASMNHRATL